MLFSTCGPLNAITNPEAIAITRAKCVFAKYTVIPQTIDPSIIEVSLV